MFGQPSPVTPDKTGGDCCPADAAANDAALCDGDRILSVYHTHDRVKFWIITEADRSATTVLLPDDY